MNTRRFSGRKKLRSAKELLKSKVALKNRKDAESSKSPYCIVVITFGSLHEAEEVARQLLDRLLIASGQIVPIRSMYWWAATQQDENEFQLTCFTTAEQYQHIEANVRKTHSYETCQIVQIPLGAVSTPFAEWISSTVWRSN